MMSTKKNAISIIDNNIRAITLDKEFKRCFEAEDEYFRKNKTGNKVLGTACSFCPYKFPCWGENLQMLPQQQSQAKNPKWVWYTEVSNPRVDDGF